jgi:hypothetical protein
MKKIVLALTVIILAGASNAQEIAGPKIAAKEVRHDLGRVVQGVQASHTFDVRNEGAQTLVIERVQTS